MNGGFLFDNPTSNPLVWIRFGMPLDDIHVLDENPVAIRQDLEDRTPLALILTGYYDDFITFTNLFHKPPDLEHFRGQGNDLHEIASTQFARNRAEDTSSNWLKLVVQ